MSKLSVQFFSKDFLRDFSDGTVVKNPPANAGDARDLGMIPGLGRSPGEGQMVNNKIRLITFFAARDREALFISKNKTWG